jgi:Kdo2-lipid IVA lauroyltransferase/acyltransferase
MRKRCLEDWIFYWVALAVKGFFCLFPYRIGIGFGAGVIYLLSFFYSRRFSVAYINLKSAFPHKKPDEIRWIIRRSMLNLGLSLMEFILSVKLDTEGLSSLIDFKGRENIDKKLVKGRGVVFLTAHYNSWEIMPFLGSILGYNCHVIAREQKYPKLNMLLNRYRSRWGSIVVEKGFSLKAVFKALRKGDSIGILADQSAGKSGVQVRLLGRYASANPGFISIARSTGAVVVPIFIRRKSLFRHDMDIYPVLDLNRTDKDILTDYNNILGSYIKSNPEQWLWFHKKWKYSLNKKILILSDTKPGHFKQSRVVAQELKKILENRNISDWGAVEPELVSISEVKVQWRSNFAKNSLRALGIFASALIQGRLQFLKLFITNDSYRELARDKYDYIVSAGSSMAALNIMLSIENGAFNIHILNAGIYKKRMKLNFIPEHDDIKGDNVYSYKGALVQERESIKDYSGDLRLDDDAFAITVLIGGDRSHVKEYLSSVKDLFYRFHSINQNRKINLLITTSRRTPSEVEVFLKEENISKSYIKSLIVANESNPCGLYDYMLDKAGLIFVSADSISMVSEALSLAKRVIVFKAKDIKKKNMRFLNGLKSNGLVEILEPEDLKNFSINYLEAEKMKSLDNKIKIASILESTI